MIMFVIVVMVIVVPMTMSMSMTMCMTVVLLAKLLIFALQLLQSSLVFLSRLLVTGQQGFQILAIAAIRRQTGHSILDH